MALYAFLTYICYLRLSMYYILVNSIITLQKVFECVKKRFKNRKVGYTKPLGVGRKF